MNNPKKCETQSEKPKETSPRKESIKRTTVYLNRKNIGKQNKSLEKMPTPRKKSKEEIRAMSTSKKMLKIDTSFREVLSHDGVEEPLVVVKKKVEVSGLVDMVKMASLMSMMEKNDIKISRGRLLRRKKTKIKKKKKLNEKKIKTKVNKKTKSRSNSVRDSLKVSARRTKISEICDNTKTPLRKNVFKKPQKKRDTSIASVKKVSATSYKDRFHFKRQIRSINGSPLLSRHRRRSNIPSNLNFGNVSPFRRTPSPNTTSHTMTGFLATTNRTINMDDNSREKIRSGTNFRFGKVPQKLTPNRAFNPIYSVSSSKQGRFTQELMRKRILENKRIIRGIGSGVQNSSTRLVREDNRGGVFGYFGYL